MPERTDVVESDPGVGRRGLDLAQSAALLGVIIFPRQSILNVILHYRERH